MILSAPLPIMYAATVKGLQITVSLSQSIATKLRSLTKKVSQGSFYSHRATTILNSQLQANWYTSLDCHTEACSKALPKPGIIESDRTWRTTEGDRINLTNHLPFCISCCRYRQTFDISDIKKAEAGNLLVNRTNIPG